MPKTRTKTDIQKKKMLDALKSTLGVVSTACDRAGVPRSQHYKWLKEDPEYKADVDDVQEILLDFGEAMFIKSMKEMDGATIRQFAKTKLKERGYGESTDLNIEYKELPSWLKD